MKKLGKKISFLTKIMLVVGLLISNLSSLSVVFAYEVPENVIITLEEDELNIEYAEALTDDIQKVRVDVYESYTYLDSYEDKYPVKQYELDTIEMSEDRLLKLTHSMSTFDEFDGTYKVIVEIYKLMSVLSEPVNELESLENITPEVTEELMATGTFEKEITYKRGLKLEVYDDDATKLSLVNGKYALSESDTIRVDAYLLAGGLAPSDVFWYNETKYSAEQLLALPFSQEYVFSEKLFGEYSIPVSVEVEKYVEEAAIVSEEELSELEEDSTIEIVPEEVDNTIKYSTNINVMYGTYEENNNALNSTVDMLGMSDTYEFNGNSKNGILYKFIDLTEDTVNEKVTGTMLDLYDVLESATNGTLIKYQLLKGNEDVIKKYNDTYNIQEAPEGEVIPVMEGEAEEEIPIISLVDYLKEISVDETVKVTFTSDELTISYSVVTLGDLTNDGVITEDDVLALIKLVLSGETNNKKADVDGVNGINSLDILYLREVIKTKDWNATLNPEDATLDLGLETNKSEEETLVSGDEFVVNYILKLSTDEVSGFSGKLVYDKEALELVSVESLIDSLGSYDKETGEFLYLGEEALSLPEVDDIPEEPEMPTEPVILMSIQSDSEESMSNNEPVNTPTVVTEDHVVLRAKFRALKSGNHTVSIKDTEYYNLNTYLNTEELEVETTVEILKSDDNKLTYLEVAGTVVELMDDVFEYEITIENEVTLVDLKYILSNVAASVTSTIYPEELSEGLNEVTITVVSESGIAQDYKVIVTRKEAVKETTTKVSYNNQPNYNKPVEESEPVVPSEPEEPVKEKEGYASKIIIMILIVLVIGGLVYLIFKDENDNVDDADKKINKLKKDSIDFEETQPKKVAENKKSVDDKKNTTNNKKKTNQRNNNKKKER